MDWMEAILPDDRERAHETFTRQLQGDNIDSEYRISTPDGKQRWIRDRAFPIRDQGGELIRIGGIAEDITERRAPEERIQFLAYHDALTELPHRLLLQDRMEIALAGARRNGKKVALMFLDLDQFKAINDSSLSYLKQFPVDKLKIDRSFIRNIPVDYDDAAITNAIISMARSLHIKSPIPSLVAIHISSTNAEAQ